jgi:hypothetical protein
MQGMNVNCAWRWFRSLPALTRGTKNQPISSDVLKPIKQNLGLDASGDLPNYPV